MLHEPLRRNGRLKTKEAEGKKKVPGKQGKKDHLDQTDKSKSFNSPEARHLQFASPFKLCAGKPFQILLHVEPKRRVACLDYVQKYDKSRQLFDTTLVLVSGPYNEPKL